MPNAFCAMDPTKRSRALLPSTPPCSSSAKPCNKQIDDPTKARQDFLLGIGHARHVEWGKESQRAWNTGNKDSDEDVVKVSSSSSMLSPGSPPPLQMTKEKSAPDVNAKGRCTPKRSKFHACILKIGDWKWISRYIGDLVAKFYYSNRRMVWEIVDKGLKMKIEIDWENISALKVTCPEGGPGILEVVLSQRPRFWKEIEQQPGKSTVWLRTTDFTREQATIHRRHVLQCVPWILKKHIETLLSSNHRLYSLSRENTQQSPCFEDWHSESEVLEISKDQFLYRHNDYQQFRGQELGVQILMSVGTNVVGRNHDGCQDTMPTSPISSSVPGHSFVVTRDSSGGPQQQRNMFDHSNSSLQTHPHNPYFEQWHSESEVPGISSSQDLFHSHEFGRQQFENQVSMSIGAKAVGRNHYGPQDGIPVLIPSSGAPSGDLQHRDMFNISSGRIRNDTKNDMVIPRKRRNQNLLNSLGTYANSQVQPADVTNLFKDIIRSAKRPAASPLVQQDYSVSSSSQNLMELELNNHCAFNNSSTQTFEQIHSATVPSNGDDPTTMSTNVLERISHDLLDDIDMEPTGVAEDAMVMSMANSLSNLLQKDHASATVRSSQASYAAASAPPPPPPNVSAELATHSQGVPGELDATVDIDMDLAYLLESFPFCP